MLMLVSLSFEFETGRTETRSGRITDHITILRFRQNPCLRYHLRVLNVYYQSEYMFT